MLGLTKIRSPLYCRSLKCLITETRKLQTSAILLGTPSSQGNATIVTQSPFAGQGSWLKKLQYKIGLGEFGSHALRRATIFHYEACTDKLEPTKFFEHLKLPDTLFSFFLVVQLHVWMCQARSMKEGPEGRTLRNEVLERMWQDFDTRLSKIEVYSQSKRKEILNDLLFHHQSAILSYDEGILTDDKTLANALWRTMFSKSESTDPVVIEMAVKYVRTQMNHLRLIGPKDWCLNGSFHWASCPPLT